MAALTELALKRPRALLAGNVAVLAVAVIAAAGAPGRLGIGTPAAAGEAGQARRAADLVVATTGHAAVRSGPYRVALRVIAAQLRSDPGVVAVSRGPISRDGRSTSLLVTLGPGGDAGRQRAVERIERGIDPGPLRLDYGGEVAALIEARHVVSGDLWPLELLLAPLAAALLIAAVGLRLAAAPVLCAATAVAGTLAGLRVAGAFADVSLLGVAPAALLGLALGVEAPCLLVARYRDESASAPGGEAIRRSLDASGEALVPLALGATAATLGVLGTGLHQAGSMVAACVLAAALALGSSVVCTPALLALAGRAPQGAGAAEPPLAGPPRAIAGALARSPARTGVAVALAAVLMIAASIPLLGGEDRPFSAADLPSGSQAARAAAISRAGPPRADRAAAPATPNRAGGGSLFGRLPLAAAISAAALALVLSLGVALTPRVVPVAIAALLPAAAAGGLCVLVLQEGHLAPAIGQRGQGVLETGAIASALVALASVSSSRAVTALRATRAERSFGLEPPMAAETAAAFTVPAVVFATLVAALGAGALAGADLYPAREFGLAVAVGLLADLILLRVPLLCALARWGGSE